MRPEDVLQDKDKEVQKLYEGILRGKRVDEINEGIFDKWEQFKKDFNV